MSLCLNDPHETDLRLQGTVWAISSARGPTKQYFPQALYLRISGMSGAIAALLRHSPASSATEPRSMAKILLSKLSTVPVARQRDVETNYSRSHLDPSYLLYLSLSHVPPPPRLLGLGVFFKVR